MPKIVFSEKFLQYKNIAPEGPQRIESIIKELKAGGIKKFEAPLKINEKELLCVHSERLVKQVKQLSKQAPEEGITVRDNFFYSKTFETALLACGSALKAARLCEKGFSFSIARPPGHHAGKDFFMGFCYFNNAAFAVKRIMEEKGFKKAMVVDFDLHHGNGTQNIFASEEKVFYFSMHQNPEHAYPGTGFEKENNAHIRNIQLEKGTDEKQYFELFKKNFLECIKTFRPELIAVSAGFDVLQGNESVGNELGILDAGLFSKIGKEIFMQKLPCFAVLEGGYETKNLGKAVVCFLNSFE